jgi:hypothetical protein
MPHKTKRRAVKMKRSSRLAVLGLACVGVLALASLAIAAYTSPTLKVSYAGTKTVISASSANGDDATARASIYVPTGTTLTTGQTPGTAIGTVKAQVSALALAGALLPLEGQIIVAPPGAVPASAQTACTQGVTPTATWLLVLQAAGQTINLPAYVLPTTGPLASVSPAAIVFCLAPPDIPVAQGGATFGAKFLSAELTLNGVISPVATGAWIAVWTPWQAGNGQINAAGTVVSPAAVAQAALTVKAAKLKKGAKVTGKITQGDTPLPSQKVTVWGGLKRNALKRLGTATTSAAGTFSFTTLGKSAFFQVRAVAGSRPAPPLCTLVSAALTTAGVTAPCVNPTVNGFTAQSAVVAKK